MHIQEADVPVPDAADEAAGCFETARAYCRNLNQPPTEAHVLDCQARTYAALQKGGHAVVVTPTASGKTLCYNLPVLEALLREPAARALYLFPTKALAQDQLAELTELVRPHENVAPGPVAGRLTASTSRVPSYLSLSTGSSCFCCTAATTWGGASARRL